MKWAYVTICSKDKNNSRERMPAIERYKSQRIMNIQKIAKKENLEFLILSGKFGLLKSEDIIPWYDHELRLNKVKDIANLVAMQIKEYKLNHIIFVARDYRKNPSWTAYYRALVIGCQKANCGFSWRILD